MPVTKIAGIDQRLIDWPSTRGQQIADALLVPVAVYEKRQGHPPEELAAYALDCPPPTGRACPIVRRGGH